ncbi:MAG: hypothetical protein J6T01_01995, partial [Kiritimatiellae bacterium]|nr:hypothetical protein [Kiritimatiellia bacterium]
MNRLIAMMCAAATFAAGAGEVVPYSPAGYETGVKDKATGFFRVAKLGDGRWWVVDPTGRGIVLLGVDHVTYHGHRCELSGKYHHLEEMRKKFPDEEDWRKDTVARLRKWGFNMLGAGSSDSLKHRGLVHTIFLSMSAKWTLDGDEDLWICPNEHRPCSAFPNVFHPDWPKHCDDVAAKRCAPNKDDPWLFGYFIDNELAWWGRGESATGLFEAAMKRRDGHPAKKAALEFAARAGVKPGDAPPDVKVAFLRRAAELYFSAACAAIRRHDPNHVVMGARFAGLSGAHRAVWEESGKYCDLVTFNCYAWADLDRNVVLNDAWSREEPVYDAFARAYSWARKPMLVTEWSFPAVDSGLPCTKGAGQRFRTQEERTAATELFAKSMLAMPFLVGYDYFMWVDEPELGISRAFPENTNYGLIDEKGAAYPEITGMFENLHRELGRWRSAGLPRMREAADEVRRADDAWRDETAAPRRPSFKLSGDSYRLRNSAGLALEGRIGGDALFDRVKIGGKDFGRFSFAVELAAAGGARRAAVNKVVSAEAVDGGAAIRARGGADGAEFEIDLEVRAVPGETRFLADLKKVANVGKRPFEVKRLMFREEAEFMNES